MQISKQETLTYISDIKLISIYGEERGSLRERIILIGSSDLTVVLAN